MEWWLVIRFIGLFWHTIHNCTLQITIRHRLVFSVTIFIVLVGNVFQQRTFVPLLPNLRPRRLLAISHQPPTLLTAISGVYLNLNSKSKSKSKLHYDQQSVGQSVLVPSCIWGTRPDFCYCQTAAGLFMWGALSDKRMGLSFTAAAGPRQRSHIYRAQNLLYMSPTFIILHASILHSQLLRPWFTVDT
jgi:hypothetical protein